MSNDLQSNDINSYAQLILLAVSLGERGYGLIEKIRETYRAAGISDQELVDAHEANQRSYADPLAAEVLGPPPPLPPPASASPYYNETDAKPAKVAGGDIVCKFVATGKYMLIPVGGTIPFGAVAVAD